jgi:uncharacterized protein (TIGR00251 family)
MATVELRVKPKAKRDKIEIVDTSHLDIWVTSPPVEGKANEHVVKLLSKALGVPKSSIDIIKGERGKNKVVSVDGLSREEIAMRIFRTGF